jgi:hypothetical protein
MGLEEGLEPAAQRLVPGTGLVQEGFAFRAHRPLEGLAEEDFFPVVSRFHRRRDWFIQSYMRRLAEESMDEFHGSFSPRNPA